MPTFQAIVLSGGGSKGPFGLGVLLALEKFRRERNKQVTSLYCGASVGALNATLAAQGDLDGLDELYKKLRTKDILGTPGSKVRRRVLAWNASRKPYHYFRNDSLRETVARHVKFDALKDAHLLVCVTNFVTGRLETFYKSSVIDEFLERESKIDHVDRRLYYYHRIESQDQLVQVLLASAAIPFYFPPVEINGEKYVDGGVGNNTPLRQAAYLSRYLHSNNQSVLPTICVINDPKRFSIDKDADVGMFGVIRRSLDIFHNELVQDSLNTWERINTNIRATKAREKRVASILESLPADIRESTKEQISEALREEVGVAAKMELPMYQIRPSAPLLDDVLCFDPGTARRLKYQGVEDCLKSLLGHSDITENDYARWVDEIR
jgi:predicted patatin/cPLA2 family phospholipase